MAENRYAHEPEMEEGLFGVEQPRFYEVSGEDFFRCTACGVLYDECDGNVCATRLAEQLDRGVSR